MKEKVLVVWLLVVAVFGFVFHHFWESTVYALVKAVALNLFSLPGIAKLAEGIFNVQLLP